MHKTLADAPAPFFVADNLALDFINTRYGSGEAARECFADDRNVLDWLKSAGVAAPDVAEAPVGLLALARRLRADAKTLLDAALAGTQARASLVNQILEQGRRSMKLEWDGQSARFTIVRGPRGTDAASLLEPVAAALATLLADGPLDRVRQCEGEGCSMLFCDQTKSRRRRWCSMAVCGNRMKVAAFRARRKEGGTAS
ncbi:CGNR zinc finger domain-containing protein [Castellaniella sp.]|uniref:CGNR zinc finger domain-containing protein n=1 Tax=Castellaniella sp. TaxID=1955812 RepID=UPI003C78EEA9